MDLKTMVKKGIGLFKTPVYVTVGQLSPDEVLKGKRVIVTGGGSGIGKEIAKAAALQGAIVLITGRNGEKLQKAAAEMSCDGRAAAYLAWDICDNEDMPEVFREIEQKIGGVDCWVNCAGIYPGGISYQNTTSEIWDKVFSVNLKATCMVTNAAAKYMIEHKTEGTLLTISSETASCAYTNPYGLSKAALNSYIRGMAYELAKYHIRSNGIAPGITVSEINPRDPDGDLGIGTITGRLIRPEEIAQTALFLLSDAAKCINGEIITCNGGNCIQVEYSR